MLPLLYRLHIFASDEIKEERNKNKVFAFFATFEQLSLQKATFDFFGGNFWTTFWEISGNFSGNLEQLVVSSRDQSNLIQKIQHRSAYVSMYNFDKMHWMETFLISLKHKSYLEQQILKISVQLDKYFSKYLFSKAKITRFEKTS